MQTTSTPIPFRAIAAAIGVIAIIAAGVVTFARPTKASVTVVTDGPTEPTVIVEPAPETEPAELPDEAVEVLIPEVVGVDDD